jgi:hypothetical protein
MAVFKSINEPLPYSFEGMMPSSINEPPNVPAGVLAPKITLLTPNTHAIGGPDITVQVTGTGFFDKSVCFVGDVIRTTVFNADGTLSVTFKPATRNPGVMPVVVRNGAYSSNSMPFTFTATKDAE